MRISQSFPSKWLKADDIGMGKKIRCRIREVAMETVSDEDKIVIYFQGKDKGLLCNRTNAGILANAYGDETDDWVGKELFLYVQMVNFQGRMVPGIKVDTPRVESSWPTAEEKIEQPRRTRAAVADEPPPHDDSDLEIPF